MGLNYKNYTISYLRLKYNKRHVLKYNGYNIVPGHKIYFALLSHWKAQIVLRFWPFEKIDDLRYWVYKNANFWPNLWSIFLFSIENCYIQVEHTYAINTSISFGRTYLYLNVPSRANDFSKYIFRQFEINSSSNRIVWEFVWNS